MTVQHKEIGDEELVLVIPGCAVRRRPGIHLASETVVEWIPGSRFARPGMTV
jgi:hypothetical protein